MQHNSKHDILHLYIYIFIYMHVYIYIHMSAQDIMCKTIYTSSGFGGFLLSRKHYQLQCCPSQVPAPAVDGVPLVSWAISI